MELHYYCSCSLVKKGLLHHQKMIFFFLQVARVELADKWKLLNGLNITSWLKGISQWAFMDKLTNKLRRLRGINEKSNLQMFVLHSLSMWVQTAQSLTTQVTTFIFGRSHFKCLSLDLFSAYRTGCTFSGKRRFCLM